MLNTNIKVKENVLSVGSKRTCIPVHIQQYHWHILENMYEKSNNIYLTPKVDGILSNFEYCGNIFECENMDNNMFLIDILNNEKNQSYYMRFKLLEKIFNTKILCEITNLEDYYKYLEIYSDTCFNLEETLLVIKPIFFVNKLNLKTDFKNTLEIIFNSNLQYKTDGWIIYADNLQTLKKKPSIYMSIDIEYIASSNNFMSSDKFILKDFEFENNGDMSDGVYRCYYSLVKNKWIAKEKRNDKIRGNKIGTIITIKSEVENYYTEKKYVNSLNLNPYYTTNIKNKKKTLSQDFRNTCLIDIINIISNKSISILDIGCGNGSLYSYLNKNETNIFYTGIDIDPYILSKTPLGGCYLWQDINNLDIKLLSKQIFNVSSNGVYDTVIFSHSLHYSTNIKTLFKTLEILTNQIIIIGIFEDYFNYNFKLEDVKVDKRSDGMFDFYYSWKQEKITEKILRTSDFENIENWKIIAKKHYSNSNHHFINMHQMLILQKI